jgi:hypothetical protein
VAGGDPAGQRQHSHQQLGPAAFAQENWPARRPADRSHADKKVVWALRDWTTLGPASSTQLLDEPGAAGARPARAIIILLDDHCATRTRHAALSARLTSIDTLRGIVMILMALDHVRDFFGVPGLRPTNLAQTTVPLFFTRWITHLCAPTFFLLTEAAPASRSDGEAFRSSPASC